ncbi:peptidoglycan editing factor PgeF [Cupriavidus sp. AU9028]|uniref:peptidoglycan editing factor PgeF n=1 Tax=Cupriavidus sp. AU9028 TaxID=2871157 RepID=UPI00351D24AF
MTMPTNAYAEQGAAADGQAWLRPDWPAPPRVRSLSTTRQGGVSAGPYGLAGGRGGGLNLGTHVGDDPAAVAANRELLARLLPAQPRWLEQVHGCEVVVAAAGDGEGPPVADAAVSAEPGRVCAVMTADCLPVLLCDAAGTVVGAAHAGWRGLCAGVIERTVQRMAEIAALAGNARPRWMAWLGPAIGPARFEVGAEVRDAFLRAATAAEAGDVEAAFRPASQAEGGAAAGKYLADIYALARIRLRRAGCDDVHGGDACTVSDAERFYSYRRDGVTGRMATLIWLDPAG